MQSDSNPLLRELARGRHGEPHPDSDLLTALSEGTLLQREHQQVLAHLANCADCRETLSTAAGAAGIPDAELKPFLLPRLVHSSQRMWLPWMGIAASILVVFSAGLLYQQRHTFQKGTQVATREAPQLPSSSPEQAPVPPQQRKEIFGKTTGSSELKNPKAHSSSEAINAANAISKAQLESAKKPDFSQQMSYQDSAVEGEMATPGISVQKAAPAQPVSAFASAPMARALSTVPSVAVARPHWHINALGQPERSFENGEWQPVFLNEKSKMRVISVFNEEVWIGGENSRLYHSTDSGVSWTQIALPGKDGREHSIAHIHFQTAQSGTVESDDGTVWITSDGGSTWK